MQSVICLDYENIISCFILCRKSLDEMSELFQRNKSTISRHIKNILDEGELDKKAVVANYATTAHHGTPRCAEDF